MSTLLLQNLQVVNKYSETCPNQYLKLNIMYGMAIGVVEFSREGYKIRKDFA